MRTTTRDGLAVSDARPSPQRAMLGQSWPTGSGLRPAERVRPLPGPSARLSLTWPVVGELVLAVASMVGYGLVAFWLLVVTS